jgi:hypothetical protein
MKSYVDIYEKCYKRMPQVFSSYDFGVLARSMGVPPNHTVWSISRFLLKRCGRLSHMTWDKRQPPLVQSFQGGPKGKYDEVYTDKLEQALSQMPDNFGSKQFILACVSLGVPRGIFDGSDLCATFLKLHTDRLTYRTWSKRAVKGNKTESQLMREAANKMTLRTSVEPVTHVSPPTVEECIEFLKSKGYRVMKPVSEWVEI